MKKTACDSGLSRTEAISNQLRRAAGSGIGIRARHIHRPHTQNSIVYGGRTITIGLLALPRPGKKRPK